ncbi:MAG: AAA family ATPase [Bacteroidota bacterium]
MVAVIGPRQCGKSTFVRQLLADNNDTVYLDLEKPSELNNFDDAEWFLLSQKGKIICIDKVQRKPDLVPVIRSLIDEWQNFP